MRTTDRIIFPVKELVAIGKVQSVGRDEWLHAIAEVYDEPRPADSKQIASGTYPVTVDYSLSLAKMIKAGKYDWKNDNITAKNFPVKGEGKQAVVPELVHLNRFASTDEVLAHMEANNLRPATLPELLAFGEKYPDVQREFPIVALGSSWVSPDGGRGVTCLWGGGGGRRLDLIWCEVGWGDSCRFLVVRK